ncbi:transporter [Azotobacter vinelandii]
MLGAVPVESGFYNLNYAQHYTANRLRNNDGSKAADDFDLRAEAIVTRLVYVSDKQLLGGRVAGHVVLPFVSLDVRMNGQTDSDKGIGDMVFGFGLGYDYSSKTSCGLCH